MNEQQPVDNHEDALTPFVEDVLDHISPRAIERAQVIAKTRNKADLQRKRIQASREMIIKCRLAERGLIDLSHDRADVL